MITFAEHEKDPGFRQRAAVLEPKLRAKIALDEGAAAAKVDGPPPARQPQWAGDCRLLADSVI